MIKIYIYKIFFYILGNYPDFENFINTNKILFQEEFKERFNEKKGAKLTYYMIPNIEEDKLKIFNKNFEKFYIYKLCNFNKPLKDFVDYIINNGFDSFYMITTDLIISNLSFKEYDKNSNEY